MVTFRSYCQPALEEEKKETGLQQLYESISDKIGDVNILYIFTGKL